MSDLADKAAQLAAKLHAGQYRRDGKTPYISHCARVVKRLEGEDEITLAIGWLHDTLEDTAVTPSQLLTLFPHEVVRGVEALSNLQHLPYSRFMEQVLKGGPRVRRVKREDILDNLSDRPTDYQIIKYCTGLKILLTGLP